ncbi:hypothetical protein TL16_g08390 [Triparma laevis f. inornata]|uniref:Uncharacterized protein n=1 Tax=Triparma laevis f. inornata TaxID=1714386 RepID=A0A9W7EIM9_9STRA|nr:hypothetical protein TL16_g08390 [Triparma laevis f. inornata]
MSTNVLSVKDKRAIRVFLDRFDTPTQSSASAMTLLYGLSALLSSHGLKHISQITSLDNITLSQRKRVIAALESEPVGRRYWNGKPDASKRPPMKTSHKNYNRKTVIKSYPFTDPSSADRVIRRNLPHKDMETKARLYACMNDYGVQPLITLNSKIRSNVINQAYREFNFAVQGLNKSDVKEALRWCGAIGEDLGARVQALLRRVEEGGKGFFKFEEWCEVVEEAVEGDVRDKEEEREDFFHPDEPEVNFVEEDVEEEEEEEETQLPPPPPPKNPRSQIVGGNVIPWDGKGTCRTANMPSTPDNFPQKLNQDSSSNVPKSYIPKSKKDRWQIDRNHALQRRAKIAASRDAENSMVYGRAQLGGLRKAKTPKNDAGRKHLRGIIKEGREIKMRANQGKGDSLGSSVLSADLEKGRTTPLRSMWESKKGGVAQEAVKNAENFLKTNLAMEVGGSEASTDVDFRERLNELTDPNLEANVRKEKEKERRRPPLSGWIGDYSSDTSFHRKPSGWTKPREETSRDTR